MANPLTGGFDVVFQTRSTVIDGMYRAIHRDGALHHRLVDVEGNQRLDLVINVPAIEMVPSIPGDTVVRALAKARVFYHQRPLDDPAGAMIQAVADVTVKAKLTFPAGDPSPVTASKSVDITWDETQLGDIIVIGQTPAVQQTVRATLLTLIRDRGDFQLALGSLSAFGINGLGARVYQPAQGTGISFGLRLGTGVATRAGLGIHFSNQDWGLALSSEFITAQVATALRSRLGPNLPPPFGSAPLKLSTQTVCVLPAPWPFEGCLQTATQSVFLDVLFITLTAQGIQVNGAVRQSTDAWFVPPVSATWSTLMTLGVDAGGHLTVVFTDPQVQVAEWYAVVANAISGGALVNLVRDAILSALSSVPSGALTAGFNQLLPEVAAFGRLLNVGLTLSPSAVEHRATGVIVHGQLHISGSVPPPVAAFHIMPGSTPQEVLLHAGDSWAPGAEIVEYNWSFGDGQTTVLTGAQLGVVVRHTYAPGQYSACLTVKDSLGRSATTCRALAPGILVLSHVTTGNQWEFCESTSPIELTFRVDGLISAPVAGALVEIAGQGWNVQGATGTNGVVSLMVDPAAVRGAGPHIVFGAFNVGTAQVTAQLPGYPTASHAIGMMDCLQKASVIIEARRHRERILDRLAGYAFLKELKESGILTRTTPDLDPRASDALDLGRAIDTLIRLENLAESSSGVITAHEVFGIRGDGPELIAAMRERMDQMWERVDRRGREMEEQFLKGRPPGH